MVWKNQYLNIPKHATQRHKESCYGKQAGHYDSIIRINILRSDSLDVCTRGGLYCSAEPLPMGFTLLHTRLAFKRLRPLSCHRLGPPTTLTTWVSLLYMRLTDPLEFRDAILTWIHILIYTLHTTMRSPHETHGITPITYNFHDPHTITTTCYLNIESSCTFSTNQTESLMLLMLTYKFQCIQLIQLMKSHHNHARLR